MKLIYTVLFVFVLFISEYVTAQSNYIFGTTSNGGEHGQGTIYQFDLSSKTHKKLVDFDRTEKGASPNDGIILVEDDLFGMTIAGGDDNIGTLYKYNISSEHFEKITDFNGAEYGSEPSGRLFLANDGYLYGMTSKGGLYDYGTLFKLHPDSDKIEKLIDFDGSNFGASPRGSLIQGNDDNLYGLTNIGGIHESGTIFKFNIFNHTISKLFDFESSVGSNPYGDLFLASNGKFYGTTKDGGDNGCGTLFEFNPITNIYSNKVDFLQDQKGTSPRSYLTEMNGCLYGLTCWNGQYDYGSIYEYNLTTNKFEKKIQFWDDTNGFSPACGLIQIEEKLYGTTNYGGYNGGVLFEYNPHTNNYQVIHYFSDRNEGENPMGNLCTALSTQVVSRGTDKITACDSLTWIDGITYTSNNNTASYTLTGSSGYDSIVNLDLTIIKNEKSISYDGEKVFSNQNNASYQWLYFFNEFEAINGATNQDYTPTKNGQYAVRISQDACVDTSAAITITNIDIPDHIQNPKATFNLIQQKNSIKINVSSNSQYVLSVYKLNGTMLLEKNIQKGVNIINFNYGRGIYLVNIKNSRTNLNYKIIMN
ncbi:choice-of-anchor tandem repeat GloVer-containing protein [Saccharicrinis sp. FJH2]|uniref:choice-of-anchor tandem repeat GloVer-containing protein n=1 Tax=Saccharicrinis sp. FJH65 TaxID=3344659 RepID=UPI0035F27E61